MAFLDFEIPTRLSKKGKVIECEECPRKTFKNLNG
jgi:hypothetical protein